MPLLRAKELKPVIDKAQIRHALCDLPSGRGNAEPQPSSAPRCRPFATSTTTGPDGLDAAMSRHSPRVRQRRHRVGRHLHHRLHVGHHRHPQGHHAFPPRRDGHLRLLAAPRAARHGRRRLYGQPAAGLHLWPGWSGAVPHVGGCVHRAAGKGRATPSCWKASRPLAPPCCSPRPRPTAPWHRRAEVLRNGSSAPLRIGG